MAYRQEKQMGDMQGLMDSILENEILDKDTKLELLANYEERWGTMMATTTQSKEELAEHLMSFKIIQDAIATLKGETDGSN